MASDFHKYVQQMKILDQKQKEQESARSDTGKGRKIDKKFFASPSLQLLHERRIVVNDQNHNLSTLVGSGEQTNGGHSFEDN